MAVAKITDENNDNGNDEEDNNDDYGGNIRLSQLRHRRTRKRHNLNKLATSSSSFRDKRKRFDD